MRLVSYISLLATFLVGALLQFQIETLAVSLISFVTVSLQSAGSVKKHGGDAFQGDTRTGKHLH
jgi:uncharacterized membrane protein